jgi:hypothetical protein
MGRNQNGSCLLLLSLLVSSPALARTWHVAVDGLATNPGTEDAPLASIQQAAASPGDTVFVHAGTYRERIALPWSGEDGLPIVIQGERGPNGEWLTQLDGSEPVSGWEPAPEIGAGVFKTSAPTFVVENLFVGDRQVFCINPKWIKQKYTGVDPALSWQEILSLPETAAFWDGVEGLFLYHDQDKVLYLRLRKGDDPRNLETYVAPGTATLSIVDRHHIVIRDLLLTRNAKVGILIQGQGAYANVVEHCHIFNGRKRVLLQNSSHDNEIRFNTIVSRYLSDVQGGPRQNAWGHINSHSEESEPRPEWRFRQHMYDVNKYLVGNEVCDDCAVCFGVCCPTKNGENNVVRGNHLWNGALGISDLGALRGFDFRDNVIHNFWSVGVLIDFQGEITGEVHDNLVYDCNINLRMQCLDYSQEGGNPHLFVYRNRFHDSCECGSHIYFHVYSNMYLPPTWTIDRYRVPEIWIYHNSFSGGLWSVALSGYLTNKDPEHLVSGAPLSRTVFVNNVFSSSWVFENYSAPTGANSIKAYDYNYEAGDLEYRASGYGPWVGEHNLGPAEFQPVWSWDAVPDFTLPAENAARSSGVDVSTAFRLVGLDFSALAGMPLGYFEGGAPNMGAVQGGGECTEPGASRLCGLDPCFGIQSCREDGTWEGCRYVDPSPSCSMAEPDAPNDPVDGGCACGSAAGRSDHTGAIWIAVLCCIAVFLRNRRATRVPAAKTRKG